MKPSTKNVMFLAVAFAVVFVITTVTKNPAGENSTGTTSASRESMNPNASGTVASPATSSNQTYRLTDVAKHKTATDCWTAVDGKVYNLTPFVNQHPGGVENITKICGIDGTEAFKNQHEDQRRPNDELATLQIGTLAK